MPRISAATNAAQRENTKRAILESFGQLLYSRGLPGLTMTDVAKNAGIGRTAVYNYFADMGELLVAYALDETERFLHELDEGITGVTNPSIFACRSKTSPAGTFPPDPPCAPCSHPNHTRASANT